MAIALKQENLSELHNDIAIPTYNREAIDSNILHVGVGGFHRAHQALYTDDLLQHHGERSWGICGVALLESDRRIYETLKNQDGLYTLMYRAGDGKLHARVIGSIVDVLFAPQDPQAVIDRMADEETRIISLTITEGGYNFDQVTGEFLSETPSIQQDIANPGSPKTIFGYLTQAITKRREEGREGFTILSCDNIQQNGEVAKTMLMAYVGMADPSLKTWIETNVTFPNCMVDRITPVTATEDITALRETYGLDDKWPVICEPFYQWVIEDRFASGRPDWDKAGAQFVEDVHAYEKMKIGLVNGGHTALAFSGYLHGYRYVCDVAADPVYASFVSRFIEEEVTPVLDEVPGIDLVAYKKTLKERFENPHIKDQLTRVFLESSAKIPKFLVPTIREQLAIGGPILCGVIMIAAWCRYLELADTPGHDYQVQDVMKELLQERARESMGVEPLAFLKISELFGGLAANDRFTETYLEVITAIRKNGIRNVLENLHAFNTRFPTR